MQSHCTKDYFQTLGDYSPLLQPPAPAEWAAAHSAPRPATTETGEQEKLFCIHPIPGYSSSLPEMTTGEHSLTWWNQNPCSVQCKKHITLFLSCSLLTAVRIKFHLPAFSSFTRVSHNSSQAWLHNICRCQHPMVLLPSLSIPKFCWTAEDPVEGLQEPPTKVVTQCILIMQFFALLPDSTPILIHDISPSLCHYLVQKHHPFLHRTCLVKKDFFRWLSFIDCFHWHITVVLFKGIKPAFCHFLLSTWGCPGDRLDSTDFGPSLKNNRLWT